MSDILVHDTDNIPPAFFGLRLASQYKGIAYNLCHYRVIYKLGHCRVICNLGHYRVIYNRVILCLCMVCCTFSLHAYSQTLLEAAVRTAFPL